MSMPAFKQAREFVGRTAEQTRQFTEATVIKLAGPVPPNSSDDGRAEIRRGLVAMFIFFVLFLGFAAFAPLDAAVVGMGYVAVSGNRETIAHRDGGVVSRVAVNEGQRVRAGDILIELAAAETLAQERSLFNQLTDLQIRRARLTAESANSAQMEKPVEWTALSSEDQASANAIWDRHMDETGGGSTRGTWSAVRRAHLRLSRRDRRDRAPTPTGQRRTRRHARACRRQSGAADAGALA